MDDLLADLDELQGDSIDASEQNETLVGAKSQGSVAHAAQKRAREGDEDAVSEDELPVEASQTERINRELIASRDISKIAKLWASDELKETIAKIRDCAAQKSLQQFTGLAEDHPEYQLIVHANNLTVEIDNEIMLIHKFIRDLFAKKFPELESLVLNPLEYVKTVQIIGNKTEFSDLDAELRALLPPATIMVLTISWANTSGQALTAQESDLVQKSCDIALDLENKRAEIVDYVQSRMDIIAPNTSAIVGSTCAAQLMGAAGGLAALSRIPACNIPMLGASRKVLAGFSSANPNLRTGYLFQAEIIQRTPPDFRKRAVRVISAKLVLAARVDSAHEATDGSVGSHFRTEIDKKIEKWQEPPPARETRALMIPDEGPKKRRGGKRYRKMKEKYAVTEMQKQQNRIQFGVAEEEVIHFDETEGLGMLSGAAATGKVRAITVDTRQKIKPKSAQSAVAKKGASSSSSSVISGTASSVVFTPVQGMEFVDPTAQQNKLKAINEKWFAKSAQFLNAKKDQSK